MQVKSLLTIAATAVLVMGSVNAEAQPKHTTKVRIHLRAVDTVCSGAGESPMSVSGVAGTFCVSGTACSGNNSKGACPGPQDGLEFGSICSELDSGIFGCMPSDSEVVVDPTGTLDDPETMADDSSDLEEEEVTSEDESEDDGLDNTLGVLPEGFDEFDDTEASGSDETTEDLELVEDLAEGSDALDLLPEETEETEEIVTEEDELVDSETEEDDLEVESDETEGSESFEEEEDEEVLDVDSDLVVEENTDSESAVDESVKMHRMKKAHAHGAKAFGDRFGDIKDGVTGAVDKVRDTGRGAVDSVANVNVGNVLKNALGNIGGGKVKNFFNTVSMIFMT